jgi:HPt (histidine-containing phosphotransfer) domain-containing protein
LTADPWFDEHALPRLERMVGVQVLGEVLDLYFDHAPKRVAAVRAGLRSKDLEAAALALHDLKSSAGMLGLTGLQQLAEEMERLARQNDAEELRARFAPLEAAVARADSLLRDARIRRGV